jgi:hypothetical protein
MPSRVANAVVEQVVPGYRRINLHEINEKFVYSDPSRLPIHRPEATAAQDRTASGACRGRNEGVVAGGLGGDAISMLGAKIGARAHHSVRAVTSRLNRG